MTMLSFQRYFLALAAIVCALSVAMSAYASHGLEAEPQRRLLMASCFAFAHGLSLIVLLRLPRNKSNFLACSLMFVGLVLFSGSLASAAIFQTSTALAPFGGMTLIVSWCWVAVNFLKFKED
jgi:uncharacterized membrane protein YgdD (TMEM256/DUF423 family)